MAVRRKLNSHSDFLTSKATFAELSKLQRTKADARFIDGKTVNDLPCEKRNEMSPEMILFQVKKTFYTR